MANTQRGYAVIELDRPRTVKFDVNAIAELEDALGKPISQLNETNVGIREIRAMVWAGLLHENPKLTLREVGEMIPPDRLKEIADKITKAFQSAFGIKNPKAPNATSGPNGTGEESNA